MTRTWFRAGSVPAVVLVVLLSGCGGAGGDTIAAQTPAAGGSAEPSGESMAGDHTGGDAVGGDAVGGDQMAGDQMAEPVKGALTPAASLAALAKAGWMPKAVAGMPHTASGVPQVGYLEVTSPGGLGIDVQFLRTAAAAVAELAAAEKSMAGCHGSTVKNAMVFSRGDGKAAIPARTLAALTALLRA